MVSLPAVVLFCPGGVTLSSSNKTVSGFVFVIPQFPLQLHELCKCPSCVAACPELYTYCRKASVLQYWDLTDTLRCASLRGTLCASALFNRQSPGLLMMLLLGVRSFTWCLCVESTVCMKQQADLLFCSLQDTCFRINGLYLKVKHLCAPVYYVPSIVAWWLFFIIYYLSGKYKKNIHWFSWVEYLLLFLSNMIFQWISLGFVFLVGHNETYKENSFGFRRKRLIFLIFFWYFFPEILLIKR